MRNANPCAHSDLGDDLVALGVPRGSERTQSEKTKEKEPTHLARISSAMMIRDLDGSHHKAEIVDGEAAVGRHLFTPEAFALAGFSIVAYSDGEAINLEAAGFLSHFAISSRRGDS